MWNILWSLELAIKDSVARIAMKDYCESNSKFYKFRDKLDWPRGSMMFATLFLEFWERFSAEEWTEFETMVTESMQEIDNGFFVQVQYFFSCGLHSIKNSFNHAKWAKNAKKP